MRCLASIVGALLLMLAPVGDPVLAQRATAPAWRSCPRPTLAPGAQRDPCVAAQPAAGDGLPLASELAAVDVSRASSRSPWAILASAALPGAGQAMLRQWRFIPYLALEGYAWTSYAASTRAARRDRNAYRQLASDVARAAFGTIRPHGDFDYYERMENFLESGAFDAVPGGTLEPEVDTTTFNGAMWLLARRTYWKDASAPPARESSEWQRAESFYLRRAIRPPYEWSWRGSPVAYEQFRRYIRTSNDSYRDAAADLGVVIGNHLLSTVDAYVTVQLRRRERAGKQGYELSLTVPF